MKAKCHCMARLSLGLSVLSWFLKRSKTPPTALTPFIQSSSIGYVLCTALGLESARLFGENGMRQRTELLTCSSYVLPRSAPKPHPFTKINRFKQGLQII